MGAISVSVGNVEIISLLDSPVEIAWQIFFPERDESDFEPYRELYSASHGERGFRTQAGCYAIRSQRHTILCDTGIGPGPIQFLGGIEGNLLNDMRDKGVSPGDVDTVFFTHLHGDHVGWNLAADGALNFPKARHLVPQADSEYFGRMLETNQQMQQVTPLADQGSWTSSRASERLPQKSRRTQPPGTRLGTQVC